MFQGLVDLDSALGGSLLVVDSSGTPINADATPAGRVYGPSGFLEAISTSFRDFGTPTNATNASPIVITSADHGLTTGTRITLSGIGGNTAANGTFIVTRIDANTFSLNGSSGNGAYTEGGEWNVTGLYFFSIDVDGDTGYEKGQPCQVLFTYAIAATQKGQLHSFNVT